LTCFLSPDDDEMMMRRETRNSAVQCCLLHGLGGEAGEEAKTRANLQPVDAFTLPTGKQLQKISPLADWVTRDVWQYAEQYAIPLLPLYDKGYTSIGCEPCTSLPFDPDDPRSGRWGGRKQECGIHVQPQ